MSIFGFQLWEVSLYCECQVLMYSLGSMRASAHINDSSVSVNFSLITSRANSNMVVITFFSSSSGRNGRHQSALYCSVHHLEVLEVLYVTQTPEHIPILHENVLACLKWQIKLYYLIIIFTFYSTVFSGVLYYTLFSSVYILHHLLVYYIIHRSM